MAAPCPLVQGIISPHSDFPSGNPSLAKNRMFLWLEMGAIGYLSGDLPTMPKGEFPLK